MQTVAGVNKDWMIALSELVTLKRNNDFRKIYSKGRSFKSAVLVTYVMKNRCGCFMKKAFQNGIMWIFLLILYGKKRHAGWIRRRFWTLIMIIQARWIITQEFV